MNGDKKHLKYPHQRVEERATSIDTKGLNEVKEMSKKAKEISIGTFTIFAPKGENKIQTFTVALPTEVAKSKLYAELDRRFNGHWTPKTKSELIHLSKPMPLKEIRKIIHLAYESAREID